MTANHFIWTDLSTFDVATAQADYAALFGWRYDQTFDQSISDSYHMAMQGDAPAAGLFQMPEFFQKIKMPSFWMSYVHVENLEDTLAQARQFDGAIVEIEPTAFDGESRIALLRDPAGAGFTLYEGPEMGGAADVCDRIWHGGDVTQVRAFYETLFGWVVQAAGRYTPPMARALPQRQRWAQMCVANSPIGCRCLRLLIPPGSRTGWPRKRAGNLRH